MRRLSRVVATVTAVMAIGVSAACGGDNPAPSAAPSPAPSSASSSSVEPTIPPIPKPARRPSKAGAAAFVRHWVAVLNYAGATGDTKALRRLSTNDCIKCAALWNGIDNIYAGGGRIEGGGWTVLETKQFGPTRNRYFVDATIKSDEQSLTQSSGATPTAFPGVAKRLRAFVLRPVESGWLVAELDPTA
ncbi:DUF6318 family protein [Nocardioides aurantiacus]|uniref:DUF6318 domain-containing protein n=1 Tax=Nocardioides aurantiacus TaxID=86796 RepID=A0A3N2CRI1_9ACTN|nr:hypothetical protein EDD33_0970 [Nocardioides aurantiacus]